MAWAPTWSGMLTVGEHPLGPLCSHLSLGLSPGPMLYTCPGALASLSEHRGASRRPLLTQGLLGHSPWDLQGRQRGTGRLASL